MTQFAVFNPSDEVEEPVILSFTEHAARLRELRERRAERRAKLEHSNRTCPSCRRVTVASIELCDGTRDGRGRTVPGTASVVGFHCRVCRHEWPARHSN